jgi:hypothetical protein
MGQAAGSSTLSRRARVGDLGESSNAMLCNHFALEFIIDRHEDSLGLERTLQGVEGEDHHWSCICLHFLVRKLALISGSLRFDLLQGLFGRLALAVSTFPTLYLEGVFVVADAVLEIVGTSSTAQALLSDVRLQRRRAQARVPADRRGAPGRA